MNSISFFKALLMKELNEKDLPGNQEKIAQAAEPKDKITGADFAALRAKKGVKKEVNTPNPPTDYSGKPAIPGLGPIVDVEEGKESELEKYERILHQLQNMNRSSNPSDESTKRKKIEDLKKKIAKLKSKVTEGEDHEVSMAHNSLESVIKSAMELKAKLGDNEKDIPAWIQDHITNAENYINQASKNYHEYSNGEHDMDELPDGTVELPAGDEEDAEMSLQGMVAEILSEYEVDYRLVDGKCYKIDDEGNKVEVNRSECKRRGIYEAKKAIKEEASDWERGFEWIDELPKQYGNWKIDIADDSIGFDDGPIVWYYKGDENGYRVVYTPNDYYATDIRLYMPGQDMYDSDEDAITLQSIELGDEVDDFSFEKYIKYGVKAIAKAEQLIQKAGK